LRIESAGPVGQDRALHVRLRHGLGIALADGSGGIGDGSRAAERVTESLANRFRDNSFVADSLWWCSQLKELDEELYRAGVGETTAIVLLCVNKEVYGASVGDSGAWVV